MISVFQSASSKVGPWLSPCLASVENWCVQQRFDYHFLDDELFEKVPRPLRDKLQGRAPIVADLARLTLLRDHLNTAGGIAIWVDADTFVLDSSWTPDMSHSASFGEEFWLEKSAEGRLRVFRQPHNAFMVFAKDDPVLPFLHFVAHSMIQRVDQDAIAPQMIGPKLLKSLHSLAAFKLHPEAGALSPALAAELVAGGGEAVDRYRNAMRPRTRLWNLCGSLAQQGRHERNLLALTENPLLFEVLDP